MVLNPENLGRPALAGPTKSIRVDAEADEVFEFLSQESNLARWWFRPGLKLDDSREGGWHFQTHPELLSIDLRWGRSGDWRHVRAIVEPREDGARVAMTVHPVPGCPTGCLEREAIRSRRDLSRLKSALESRSHLIDSDGYWT